MPLLRDYTAEHERAINLGGGGAHLTPVTPQPRTLPPNGWQRNCAPTGAARRPGCSRNFDEDDIFAEYIDPLVQEHRDLDAFMVSMDLSNPADQTRFRDEVSALHEHIAKEEDSLFPASVTTLSGDQWDAAIAARYTAHPGATMLEA